MVSEPHIAIVVLAAGASTRLGQAKQLVQIERTPLVRRICQIGMASKAKDIVVVVGAYQYEVRAALRCLADVHIVSNDAWKKGMASSIRTGVKHIRKVAPETAGVLLVLCDQYYLSASLLNQLIGTYQTKACEAVACTYNNTVGVPALFGAKHLAFLCHIVGEGGAKKRLKQLQKEGLLAMVPFEQGGIDIDTPEQLAAFKDVFLKKQK